MSNSLKKGTVKNFVFAALYFLMLLTVMFLNPITIMFLEDDYYTLFSLFTFLTDDTELVWVIIGLVILLLTSLVKTVFYLLVGLANGDVIKGEIVVNKLSKALKILNYILTFFDFVAFIMLFLSLLLIWKQASFSGLSLLAVYIVLSLVTYLMTRKTYLASK